MVRPVAGIKLRRLPVGSFEASWAGAFPQLTRPKPVSVSAFLAGAASQDDPPPVGFAACCRGAGLIRGAASLAWTATRNNNFGRTPMVLRNTDGNNGCTCLVWAFHLPTRQPIVCTVSASTSRTLNIDRHNAPPSRTIRSAETKAAPETPAKGRTEQHLSGAPSVQRFSGAC